MPPAEFRPRTMRLSILTAALQELTPRARRDAAVVFVLFAVAFRNERVSYAAR